MIDKAVGSAHVHEGLVVVNRMSWGRAGGLAGRRVVGLFEARLITNDVCPVMEVDCGLWMYTRREYSIIESTHPTVLPFNRPTVRSPTHPPEGTRCVSLALAEEKSWKD